MAITNISIFKDNKVGDCNLLAVHSPLVFLIDVTWGTELPALFVDIMEINEDVLGTFKPIYQQDISSTIRRFLFISDSILRGYMPEFGDFLQTAESIEIVLNTTHVFILKFRDELDTISEEIEINAFHAARQFGQTEALTHIYDNDSDFYVSAKERPVYIYFYNPDEGVVVKITDGVTVWNMGADQEILDEDFDAWTGVSPNSLPTGWTLNTNQATSPTWQVVESEAGIANFILQGAIGKYFYLYNTAYEIIPGSTNYHLNIRYRSSSASNYFMFGYKVQGGGSGGGGLILPSTSGVWTNIDIRLQWNPAVPATIRYLNFGFLKTDANNIDIEFEYIKLILVASDPGFLRLKLDDLEEDTVFKMLVDDVEKATKTVRVKPTCDTDMLLKYLDKDGQYRFYPFNKFYQTRDNPQLLGKLNRFVTDLLTAQSNTRVVGYKNERTITMIADDVPADELVKLSDIYTSPRVYLFIGDGTTDEKKDWLEVEIKAAENLVRTRKGSHSSVELDVILPENFTVTKF